MSYELIQNTKDVNAFLSSLLVFSEFIFEVEEKKKPIQNCTNKHNEYKTGIVRLG